MAFAEDQPKEGDGVLICAHVETGSGFHFFRLASEHEEPIAFTRGDKTTGKARWIVVCEECAEEHKHNMVDAITGDAIWHGNDPIILTTVN